MITMVAAAVVAFMAVASSAASLPETIKAVEPSVVQIATHPTPQRRLGDVLGTGFLITREAHVITAAHVIAGRHARSLAIRVLVPTHVDLKRNVFISDTATVFDFDVLEIDGMHDLALLKIKGDPFRPQRIMKFDSMPELQKQLDRPVGVATLSKERPQDGEAVAVSGYPFGIPTLVTNAGRLSSTGFLQHPIKKRGQFLSPVNFFLVDISVNHGNSGGPLYLAETGKVIGVVSAFRTAPVSGALVFRDITATWPTKLVYNSGIAQVVPTFYVRELARRHKIALPE